MPSHRHLCLKILVKHLVSEMDLHILHFLVHNISHIVYLTKMMKRCVKSLWTASNIVFHSK